MLRHKRNDLDDRKVPVYNRNRTPLKRRPVPMAAAVKDIELPADTFDSEADNFSIGSKVKKAARAERRKQRADDRSYKKRAKADALALRTSGKAQAAIIQAQGEAAANQTLATQGIVGNPVVQQPDLATKAVEAVTTYLGGAAQQQQQQYQQPLNDSSIGLTKAEDYPDEDIQDDPEQKPKNNSMVLIIVIVIAAYFLFLRK